MQAHDVDVVGFEIDVSGSDKEQVLKQRRVRTLRQFIERYKRVNIRQLLAKFSVDMGLAHRTINSYLRDFEDLGLIKRENGWIVWVGDQGEVDKQRLNEAFSEFSDRLGQIEQPD